MKKIKEDTLDQEKYSITVVNPFIPMGAYREGLQTALIKLFPYLNKKEWTTLLYNKLMLENSAVDQGKYVQSACELTVCAWFAHMASQKNEEFVYEFTIAPLKDVDCIIRHNGYQFNVEVKCANYQKQQDIVAKSELVVHGLGRLDDYGPFVERLRGSLSIPSKPSVLGAAHHMDCKMKDYLLSAQAKFGCNTQPNNLNILFVCVDDQMDMLKWISYLTGPGGLFTDDSFEPTNNYGNVDMVVLTNLYHRHANLERKDKISDHWNLGQAFNFAVINPKSTKTRQLFSLFSSLLPLENGNLHRFLEEADIPEEMKGALGLGYYVANQVEQGIQKFQGYSVDDSQAFQSAK